MPNFTFRYRDGQSAPYKTLGATDMEDFLKNVLPTWEAESGHTHLAGTVMEDIPIPPAAAPLRFDTCPHCSQTLAVFAVGLVDPNAIRIVRPDGLVEMGVHPVFVGPDDPTIIMTAPCAVPASNLPPVYLDESLCGN